MAIIDIGSNSVKLVLEKTGEKSVTITRLAEGLDKTGRLCDAAIKRTADAAALFFLRAKNAGERVLIFATEAARAEGGQVLSDLIYKRTGVALDILSGEQEAECGFLGAVSAATAAGAGKATLADISNVAVIDVGGASTEVTARQSVHSGCSQKLSASTESFRKSFPIGAVRLFEHFGGRTAVSTSELALAQNELFLYIDSQIKELKEFNGSVVLIGGTSGALTAIKLGLKEYYRGAVHGAKLTLSEIKAVLDSVFVLSTEERLARYPFLERGRAEIIPYGIAIIDAVMRRLDANEAIKSESGVIEGYIKMKGLSSNFI